MALQLLARLCTPQPAAALQAAQLDIPGPSETRLPALLARAVDVLSQLAHPPIQAIGHAPELRQTLPQHLR